MGLEGRCVRVLHIVPFDPSRMPLVFDTVAVCKAAGIDSALVASVPVAEPDEIGEVMLNAPTERGGGLYQGRFLLSRGLRESYRYRPDLVIGHDARGVAAAVPVAAAAGCPVVYHCEDFTPTSGLRGRLLAALERFSAGRAAEMWLPSLERERVAHQRRLRVRTVIVRNCPRRRATLPARGRLRPWLAERGSHPDPTSRLLVRHGNIGPSHCLFETMEAMAALGRAVEFVVLGQGTPDYVRACRERAHALGLDGRVHIHSYRTHSDLPALLVDADVALGVYEPHNVNTTAPAGPIKVYESMAVGLPVVVSDGNSFAREIIDEGAGVGANMARPEDRVRELLAALRTAMDRRSELGARARRAHLDRFNFEMELRNTLLAPFL